MQGQLVNGEGKQSPEMLHRWFSQASISFDPAAVLLSHARAMPKNDLMFTGICNVISQQHAAIGHASGEKFMAHGFATHAVRFLQRNKWKPKTRREAYLALSICAQSETDLLIENGLIEVLTEILNDVVRKGLETSQATTTNVRREETDREFGDLCRLLRVLLDPMSEGDDAVTVIAINEDDDARHILSDIPLIRKLQLTLWNVLRSKRMKTMLTTHSALSAENLLGGLSKY
jgi:hypothetical protein